MYMQELSSSVCTGELWMFGDMGKVTSAANTCHGEHIPASYILALVLRNEGIFRSLF